MTELLEIEIEDIYKMEDKRSYGEGFKNERATLDEVAKSTSSLRMMEKMNLLRRQLKVAEDDIQKQVMIQNNLKAKLEAERERHEAKLEERTVALKNQYNTLLSDLDYFLDELAVTKRSAEAEALKAEKLQQTVTMMANYMKHQEDTNDVLQSKIEHLEEEREMMLGFIQQMPFPGEETDSESVENFLPPAQRSLQEELPDNNRSLQEELPDNYRSLQEELPVAEKSGVVAEVTKVAKPRKKKTKLFGLKQWLCCVKKSSS